MHVTMILSQFEPCCLQYPFLVLEDKSHLTISINLREFSLISGTGVSGNKQLFIGLRDVIGNNRLSDHKWTVDGSVVTYEDWYTAQPSNPEERCTTLLVHRNLQWNDRSCGSGNGAVCEADPVSFSKSVHIHYIFALKL